MGDRGRSIIRAPLVGGFPLTQIAPASTGPGCARRNSSARVVSLSPWPACQPSGEDVGIPHCRPVRPSAYSIVRGASGYPVEDGLYLTLRQRAPWRHDGSGLL